MLSFSTRVTTVVAGKGQCPDGKDVQDKWTMRSQGTGMLQNEHLQSLERNEEFGKDQD